MRVRALAPQPSSWSLRALVPEPEPEPEVKLALTLAARGSASRASSPARAAPSRRCPWRTRAELPFREGTRLCCLQVALLCVFRAPPEFSQPSCHHHASCHRMHCSPQSADGPDPYPLGCLPAAWPDDVAWCRAALGRGLAVVWLYERPGLAFPYPLRVHPVRCLPAAWLHSSVATSKPLVVIKFVAAPSRDSESGSGSLSVESFACWHVHSFGGRTGGVWSGGRGAECTGRYGLGTLFPICLQTVQRWQSYWVTCIG